MSIKTYGTVSAEQRKAMSGLEFVQGMVTGTLPHNTIARTLDYTIAEAESGRVVITAEPDDRLLNPAGTVHGGFSATLLDSCMGLAIQSTLEKGLSSTRSNSRSRWSARSRRKPGRSAPRASCCNGVAASAPPRDGSSTVPGSCWRRARRRA